MTSSPVAPAVSLRGSQRPRITTVPPYTTTSGDEAIKLARLAGVELDEWQQAELRHGMGESPDWKCSKCIHRSPEPIRCPVHPDAPLLHPWAAFEVCDVVPRQNGKSEKLITRQLAGLYVLEEPLQIYSAHLFDTAMEIFRRLVFLIENCDDLRREVKHRGSKMVGIKYSHGEEGVELKDGRRIRFKARTAGGGRGFSCDTLYLDEAMILREAFLGATVPTLSARANPQIWLAGSAPDEEDPAHDGIVLAKRRERALAGDDPSLAYFEHSAEGDDPSRVESGALDDPAQWALANPGLGIRITTEYVAAERAAMGARQFAVERLGIGAWPDTSDDAGRVISSEVWADLAEDDRANRIVRHETFAVDTNGDQTWASICVAGERRDGLWQGATVRHDPGKDWVIRQDDAGEWHGAAVDLHKEHPDSPFVLDPRGPAANLIGSLRAARLRVIEVTTQEYGTACADFVATVVEGRFRYPDPQPELDRALADARRQDMGERWKWSRKNSTSADISPLVAVTLALWGAQNAEPQYATVLYGSDHLPQTPTEPQVGPGFPRLIEQSEYTTCFACQHGHCAIHSGEGG